MEKKRQESRKVGKNSARPRAEKIRHLRKACGWTQEQLAAKAGCSERTIENVENGNPCYPRTLHQIAGVLGCEFRDLSCDEDSLSQDTKTTPGVHAAMVPRAEDGTHVVSTENGEADSSRSAQRDSLHGERASRQTEVLPFSVYPRSSRALCASLVNKHAGLYADTLSAIRELASKMPVVYEVLFVAYVSKMLAEDLRVLPVPWRIRHLHVLLRDLDAVDRTLPGEIPSTLKTIDKRRREERDGIADISEEGEYVVEKPVDVRYYRGQPSLRGMLVREQKGKPFCAGFLNFYQQRVPRGKPDDYATRSWPVVRLSRESPYEEILLESFTSWFAFVWAKGSYTKEHRS